MGNDSTGKENSMYTTGFLLDRLKDSRIPNKSAVKWFEVNVGFCIHELAAALNIKLDSKTLIVIALALAAGKENENES